MASQFFGRCADKYFYAIPTMSAIGFVGGSIGVGHAIYNRNRDAAFVFYPLIGVLAPLWIPLAVSITIPATVAYGALDLHDKYKRNKLNRTHL